MICFINNQQHSRTGDFTGNEVFNYKIDYFSKLCNPTMSEDSRLGWLAESVHPLKKGKVIEVTMEFPILTIVMEREGVLTTINVDYSDTERVKEVGDEAGNIHENTWYGVILNIKSRVNHFNNCVFERPVNITNVKHVSFNNCFFRQGLSISDSVSAESIAIRECYVEKGVIVSESRINRLFINDSHIESMYIDECTFEKTSLFSNTFFDNVTMFNHSNFDGYDALIDDCEFGEKLSFYNCTSKSRLNVNRIHSKKLRFEKCFFRSLNVDDSKVDAAEDSYVYLEGNTFNGAVSLDNVRCPKLSMIRTNMYGGCFITRHDDTSEFATVGLGADEALISSIYISGDRVGNEFQIGKIYDHLKIEGTEFNCKIRLNCVFTKMVSKGLITHTNPESRMTETEPKVLFEISNSMKMHNQPYASEYFYIAYKAAKRERAGTIGKKWHYTAHDLLSKYGTSYARVIAWSIVTVALFTILYFVFGTVDLYTALYHSGSTFFTIGFSDLQGSNDITKILSVVEGAIGLLLMTYLIIVMTNKRY
jgi:hypothetical protein